MLNEHSFHITNFIYKNCSFIRSFIFIELELFINASGRLMKIQWATLSFACFNCHAANALRLAWLFWSTFTLNFNYLRSCKYFELHSLVGLHSSLSLFQVLRKIDRMAVSKLDTVAFSLAPTTPHAVCIVYVYTLSLYGAFPFISGMSRALGLNWQTKRSV